MGSLMLCSNASGSSYIWLNVRCYMPASMKISARNFKIKMKIKFLMDMEFFVQFNSVGYLIFIHIQPFQFKQFRHI